GKAIGDTSVDQTRVDSDARERGALPFNSGLCAHRRGPVTRAINVSGQVEVGGRNRRRPGYARRLEVSQDEGELIGGRVGNVDFTRKPAGATGAAEVGVEVGELLAEVGDKREIAKFHGAYGEAGHLRVDFTVNRGKGITDGAGLDSGVDLSSGQ